MRKKLFSAVMSFALCASLFAIDSMFLRLKNGKIFEYQVEDVEEVYFGESTPVIEDTPGEEIIGEDTTIVDIPEFPLAIYPMTDSTAYLESIIPPATFDSIIVPSRVRVEGKIYKVTQIGKVYPGSFNNTKYIEVPSSVTRIYDFSFVDCADLEVVINNSRDCVQIGECAFCGCKSVTFTKDSIVGDSEWTLPMKFKVLSDTTVEVGSCVSEYNGPITIPSEIHDNGKTYKVVGIGNQAFAGSQMTSVEIPSSVTYIGVRGFAGCMFSSIVIPSGVTIIYGDAFEFCSNLSSVILPDNISLEFEAFHGCPIENIVITSGSSVGNHCFSGNGMLSNVVFNPGALYIGGKAFMNCGGLTKVLIPSSVLEIGSYAFAGCANLEVEIDNSKDSIGVGEWAFYECKSVKYLRDSVPEEDVVDAVNTPFLFDVLTDSTASVTGWNYYNGECLLAKGIEIPSRVQIENKIYTVTSIGTKAFSFCDCLSSVKIPSTVDNIGGSAFENSSLTAVELPSNAYIEYGAFWGCYNLKSLYVPANVSLGQNAFRASGLESLILEDGLSYIGKYSFMECSYLTKVVIPSSVKTIRMGAFYDCKNLEVEVDNSMENIEFDTNFGMNPADDPFIGCKSVKYAK